MSYFLIKLTFALQMESFTFASFFPIWLGHCTTFEFVHAVLVLLYEEFDFLLNTKTLLVPLPWLFNYFTPSCTRRAVSWTGALVLENSYAKKFFVRRVELWGVGVK